jgi:acyl-CoA thioesterase I
MTGTTSTSQKPVAAWQRWRYVALIAAAINMMPPASHQNVMAQSPASKAQPSVAPNAAVAKASGKPITLVALGDSLTAGYQLPAADSYPAQLEKALRAKGYAVTIVNAGVSGDTTAAGLERLNWAVPADADAVIVALGANDMLRGQDPARARDNLDRILAAVKAQKQDILVAGMLAQPGLPPDYRAAFDRMFPDLAAKHGAVLYPFFLDGIALQPKLNLADGLHPNAAGVAVMVEKSLPKVEELVARVVSRRGG